MRLKFQTLDFALSSVIHIFFNKKRRGKKEQVSFGEINSDLHLKEKFLENVRY